MIQEAENKKLVVYNAQLTLAKCHSAYFKVKKIPIKAFYKLLSIMNPHDRATSNSLYFLKF